MNIAWGTKVIHVAQSDLTHVTGTLYELDTDWFRLALKNLEDDPEGMVFLDTHRHNTEVTVAGTTFARTIEIINGYSVEFEDGQYSVRLVGSNNNLFDIQSGILVQNNVQVIPTNSAGLIVGEAGDGSGATAAEVADAVWDESAVDHQATGSFGEQVQEEPPQPADVADAVWNEPIGDHLDPDSFGEYVQRLLEEIATAVDQVDGADPATIADAVWDEATADHVAAGSYGERVRKLLTVAKYLGLR